MLDNRVDIGHIVGVNRVDVNIGKQLNTEGITGGNRHGNTVNDSQACRRSD